MAFVLPFSVNGIVVNLAFEGFDDFFFVLACGLCDVSCIDFAVKVQAACQRFHRGERYGGGFLRKCDRLAHDVGLEDVLANLHFYREHLRAETVEHDKLLVVVVVEISPLGNESVVTGVEPFSQIRRFLLFFPFFD